MRHIARKCLVVVLIWAMVAVVGAQSPMHRVRLHTPGSLGSLAWTSLASDPKADVLQARLPDARELFYAIDRKADVLWIKVALFEPPPADWFGISVAVDIDGLPDNGMTWWGTNKVKFDRLANAFLFKADGYWQGYVGVGDSEAVARGYTGGLTKDVIVAVDHNQPALLLGIPRSTLGSAPTARILATVGSMLANNDDVPNEGMLTINLRR